MNNKVAKLVSKVSASAILFASSASFAFAADEWQTWLGKVQGPRTGGTLDTLLINLLNWGIGLTALVAVVMLIWNGVRYITANGDEDAIKKATKGITFAIIGLVICFLSILIVNFVISKIMVI